MSIRLLARDLYRFQCAVDALERELASAPAHRIDALKDKLRKTRAERDRLRAALDGQKDSGPDRRRY
jgi:hypothetical protein